MVEEAGVNLLLNTFFSDVVLQGDVLKGVIIENKSGRCIILRKVFVDATGDET